MNNKNLIGVFVHSEFAAERPASTIGKSLQLPQYTAARYLQELTTNNLAPFSVRINPWRMGRQNISLYFEYNVIKDQHQAIDASLQKDPETQYYTATLGHYDAIAVRYPNSTNDLVTWIRQFESKQKDVVRKITVLTRSAVILFPHRMVRPKISAFKPITYTAQTAPVKLDQLDHKIISTIRAADGYSLNLWARTLDEAPSTVSRRISRLISEGVILAFTRIPTRDLTGLTTYRILLSLASSSEENRARLVTFAEKHLEVIAIISTIGSWNFEVEISCASPVHARESVLRLRQCLGRELIELSIVETLG